MALLFLLAVAAGQPPTVAERASPIRVETSASVRILSGARVQLGRSADGGNYLLSNARVIVEDGTLRPARLVEFQ